MDNSSDHRKAEKRRIFVKYIVIVDDVMELICCVTATGGAGGAGDGWIWIYRSAMYRSAIYHI